MSDTEIRTLARLQLEAGSAAEYWPLPSRQEMDRKLWEGGVKDYRERQLLVSNVLSSVQAHYVRQARQKCRAVKDVVKSGCILTGHPYQQGLRLLYEDILISNNLRSCEAASRTSLFKLLELTYGHMKYAEWEAHVKGEISDILDEKLRLLLSSLWEQERGVSVADDTGRSTLEGGDLLAHIEYHLDKLKPSDFQRETEDSIKATIITLGSIATAGKGLRDPVTFWILRQYCSRLTELIRPAWEGLSAQAKHEVQYHWETTQNSIQESKFSQRPSEGSPSTSGARIQTPSVSAGDS